MAGRHSQASARRREQSCCSLKRNVKSAKLKKSSHEIACLYACSLMWIGATIFTKENAHAHQRLVGYLTETGGRRRSNCRLAQWICLLFFYLSLMLYFYFYFFILIPKSGLKISVFLCFLSFTCRLKIMLNANLHWTHFSVSRSLFWLI